MTFEIRSSANLLKLVRAETEVIGVAVSFGKDSLATLDLCTRIFKRVEAYYLFRVRDLEIVKTWSEQVFFRYGVNVRHYPHFDLSRCYRWAVLQPHWNGVNKTKRIDMKDIENVFRLDAAVEWIAYGWRRNDSFSRALIMKKCAGYDPRSRRVFPLRTWRRADVYAYLKSREIPIPATLGRKEQGGLDFHPGALAELKEHHAGDYKRWLKDFPFAGAQLPATGRADPEDIAGPMVADRAESNTTDPRQTESLSIRQAGRNRPAKRSQRARRREGLPADRGKYSRNA